MAEAAGSWEDGGRGVLAPEGRGLPHLPLLFLGPSFSVPAARCLAEARRPGTGPKNPQSVYPGRGRAGAMGGLLLQNPPGTGRQGTRGTPGRWEFGVCVSSFLP